MSEQGAKQPRSIAVAGGVAVSALSAAVNLGYQITLLSVMGASHTLDAFFLCRTLPFLLEQLGGSWFLMAVFPGLVFTPVSLAGAVRRALALRFTLVLVGSYLILLARPMLFFDLVGRDPGLAALDALSPRMLVAASFLLTLDMLVVGWFNGRERYLVGIWSSLANVATMLGVLFLLRSEPTLATVAISFTAGVVVQTAWLFGAYALSPAAVPAAPASQAPEAVHGSGRAIGLSIVGATSPLMDRVTSAWLPAGNVSILKIGRQLLETAAQVFFGTLASSSYTLQCQEVRERKSPDPLLLRDCRLVALCAGLLIVGLLSECGERILALLFGHGHFGIRETADFHRCLAWMSPLLFLVPVRTLLAYRWFSEQKHGLTLVAAGVACAVDAGSKLALLPWGLAGLALANSLALVVHTAVLAGGLPRPHALAFAGVVARFLALVGLPVLGSRWAPSLLPLSDPWGLAGLVVAGALFLPLAGLLFRRGADRAVEGVAP